MSDHDESDIAKREAARGLLSEYRRTIGSFDERARRYEESFLTILGGIFTIAIGLLGLMMSLPSHEFAIRCLSIGASFSGILLTIVMFIRLRITNSLRGAAIQCAVDAEKVAYPDASWNFAKFTTRLNDAVDAKRHEHADQNITCLLIAAFVIAILFALFFR